jgi:DNA-directed RNA polymerase subunit RPC12/RpoP
VLVNEKILEEFERNKTHTKDRIDDIEKKSKAHIAYLQSVKDFAPKEKETIDKLVDQLKITSDEKIEAETKHISKVEAFLKSKTKIIDIIDAHMVEAAKMALDKKAPFTGDKRNSMADALHLLSMVDHIKTNEKVVWDLPFDEEPIEFMPKSFFVSSNSGDFSDPAKKENIHPDLIDILKRSKTLFHHSLTPLLRSLESELLTPEVEEIIEEADLRHCEICDFDYSNIDYNGKYEVFDPRKLTDTLDESQLQMFGPQPSTNPYIVLQTAQCDHCGTDFLECPDCDELIVVDDYNKSIECPSCSFKFILHAEKDRKGMIYEGEYEILVEHECVQCGDKVESITADGLCDECVKYNQDAEYGD